MTDSATSTRNGHRSPPPGTILARPDGTPLYPPPRPEREQKRADPLTGWARAAAVMVTVMIALLGLLGFVNSFAAVERAARPTFGALSWTVPLAIDLGIASFVALDLVMARMRTRALAVRAVAWTLSAVTIYLNVAPETTWGGRVAHGALVGLWVAAVEIGAYVVRWHAQLNDDDRTESIPVARWLLAPVSTMAMWRRRTLWGIRQYAEVLRRERDRQLAVAAMREEHGILWRVTAPRRQRVLLRLSELSPDELWQQIEAEEAQRRATAEAQRRENESDSETVVPPSGTIVTTRRQTASSRTPARQTGRRLAAVQDEPEPEFDADLLQVATEIYLEHLEQTGKPPARPAMISALKERRGVGIKSTRYSALKAAVEARLAG